jgi:hypothetical protein
MAVPGAPDSAPSNGSLPRRPPGPAPADSPAGPPPAGSPPAGSLPGGPPAGGLLPIDPLPEAVELASGAARAGLGLKLLGGLAVRVLCPEFPPRLRRDQDIDFACLSKERKKVAAHLADAGCEPDRRFNNLNGDRQMYFNAPSGRPIDVMVDRLAMCHTLDLRPSFSRLPLTVDAIDVLLSKLQIIELNEKDVRDVVHLLAALPLGGSEDVSLDVDRFCRLLGADWGWWRTVTGNLAKLPALIAERPDLVPPNPAADPVTQAQRLAELAEETPKSVKWRVRAGVGDRVRWYELPEEVAH